MPTLSPDLQSLVGRHGNTKRVRTLRQAKALVEAEWAEKFDGKWGIAEEWSHRTVTRSEARLLNRAAKRIQKRSE